MKLLIAGNLANYGYFLAKMIRKYGINAHLLMPKFPKKSQDPLHFENDLLEYPEWIDFWNNKSINWKYEIIKKMREFDLIQSSTELPMFSLFSGKPNISFTTGSDIVELAHKNNLKGFLLRRAYKKSKIVIFPGLYMYESVVKLKLKNAIFIPPLWDYNKFNIQKIDNKNQRFTIFHPTGHVWRQKGNDLFLRAFVKLVKKYSEIHLILIDRGTDFQKSKAIIGKEILEKNVTIIPESIPQNKIKEYYIKSDVVVDQFYFGSTGLIGQEAMSCEKPLIQYMNKGLYEKFYSEIPPIISAITEKQIFEELMKLIDDRELGKKIGKKSREWLLKYHNVEKNIQKYLFVYNAINDGIEFKKIAEYINSIKY